MAVSACLTMYEELTVKQANEIPRFIGQVGNMSVHLACIAQNFMMF